VPTKPTEAPKSSIQNLDDADSWAAKYSADNRQRALAKADLEARKNGYLTTDNKDVYETTIFTNIMEAAKNDPRVAKQMMTASHPAGWQIYSSLNEPDELLAYMGEARSLREAILTDTGNSWTGVLAYVKSLSPTELQTLKTKIPDIDWVAQKAAKYNAPSEAARADVVGLKVTFNPDGTITLTRQSTNEYFGSGGGVVGGGTGGTQVSRTGVASNATQGRMGGGSAPARSGGSAPQAQPPQDTGAEWNTFAASMANNPSMLVRLQDYFAMPDYAKQAMLQRYPDLALYISQLDPARLASLQKAYLAWVGKQGQQTPQYQGGSFSGFSPTLRVYNRRSGRSGL
jgi:hypothetical protein